MLKEQESNLGADQHRGRDLYPSFRQQLRLALLIVWFIISCLALILIITPFVIDSSALMSVYPNFDTWHTDGQPCLLCGMTRAFYSIADGQWEQARLYNSGSLWLFGLMAVNSFIVAACLIRLVLRKYLRSSSY